MHQMLNWSHGGTWMFNFQPCSSQSSHLGHGNQLEASSLKHEFLYSIIIKQGRHFCRIVWISEGCSYQGLSQSHCGQWCGHPDPSHCQSSSLCTHWHGIPSYRLVLCTGTSQDIPLHRSFCVVLGMEPRAFMHVNQVFYHWATTRNSQDFWQDMQAWP